MQAETPPDEAARLAALYRYNILDTPREAEFDDIIDLVSAICDAPIAVVNLIDEQRQWFKAETGLGVRETPLAPSICAHAILQNDLFIIEDTTADPRFCDNPLVTGDPRLRFYAGTLLVSSDGHPLGTLCVLDVKPRTLTPSQIKALQTLGRHVMHLFELRVAMERESHLKSEFALALETHKRLLGVVSHDLRAPLNVINISAETLNAEQLTKIDTREIGGRLRRACDSMSTLIDDLIDYESIRRGALSLCIIPCRVADILRTASDTFAATAEEAGIQFSVDAQDELPDVLCDASRVSQILTNLIQNAIKFTPAGGAVHLRAAMRDSEVGFTVTDTGRGISADHLKKVFEPHWRADDTQALGAGLGLSIVLSLVEVHGGNLHVTSTPGEGSSFGFTLRTS